MNINQIIEKLNTDKALAEKYAALQGIDAILAQAKADGFEVSREDVEAVLSKLGEKSGELSEVDLAAVAGGTDDKNFCKWCGGERGRCGCSICPKCGDQLARTPGTGTCMRCGTKVRF